MFYMQIKYVLRKLLSRLPRPQEDAMSKIMQRIKLFIQCNEITVYKNTNNV